MGGVDDHAGKGDTLGGELALVVAEAETELVGQAVPSGSRAPGGACEAGAQTGHSPWRPVQGAWGGVLVTKTVSS